MQYSDALIANLNLDPRPEVILLDTADPIRSKLRLIRDVSGIAARPDGRTMATTGITVVTLEMDNTPNFLLEADFDADGVPEVWAIDREAQRADCFVVPNTTLTPCP